MAASRNETRKSVDLIKSSVYLPPKQIEIDVFDTSSLSIEANGITTVVAWFNFESLL